MSELEFATAALYGTLIFGVLLAAYLAVRIATTDV